MDIIFINSLRKVDFFYIIEYLIQLVQADVVLVMLYVAVDVIFDFIIMEKTVFFLVVAKTILVFFSTTISFGGHYLLNVHIFSILSFFYFIDFLFSIDGRVMPI